MSVSHTASATALRTALIMVVFTTVFTALMAAVHEITRPTIEASGQAEKLRLVNAILPPGSYDNALLDDSTPLGPTPALGLDDGGRIYRARRAGQPVAAVLETIAADGYGGQIHLLVAIGADQHLLGVRVIGHHETPGLGDYIDPAKDRDKAHPWIGQFTDVDLKGMDATAWGVAKDGGRFTYHTGATISARAVTRAVGRAVAFVTALGPRVYGPAADKGAAQP